MKKILFYDTETNSLPLNFHAPISDLNNWPRVTQQAWQLCYENGEVIQEMSETIYPDGWTIPKEKFFIENGHTTENCLENGVPMPTMLKYFIQDLESADLLVAHNLGFDLPVISAEMLRYGLKPSKKTAKFCTKIATTEICKIPNPYYPSKFKWPKLEEAYKILVGDLGEGAHQADFDVEACKQVFLVIKEKYPEYLKDFFN